MNSKPVSRARGQKTYKSKQKESHIIWAIDNIDQALKHIESEKINVNELKNLLKKIRKEVSKI